MEITLTEERIDQINESLSLIQRKGGLTFGTDAYLLAAFVRSNPSGVCCELGGGCGVIPLLCLSRNKFRRMATVELQEVYADIIRRNAELNGMADRITVLHDDVRNVTPDMVGGECDAVLSNPPYMRNDSGKGNDNPEMSIARRELNGTIGDFCRSAARLLKFGGLFYVVYRPDRLAELFAALHAASLEPKRMVTVYPSASDKPCLVLVEAKKGAKPALIQSPPLIIYRDEAKQTYTTEMDRVYENCSLDFLFD